MNPFKTLALWLSIFATLPVSAASFDYQLDQRVQQLGEGIYAIVGDDAHFNPANGGNILNTGFVVGAAGVVVIDTGPSLAYGRQQRQLIDRISGAKPIALVINTHHHPDHFFGNQAYADVPIAASEATRRDMTQLADGYSDALYRLVGRAMFGTEYRLPSESLAAGALTVAGLDLRVFEVGGHTDSELMVQAGGVLFGGDVVFNGRAPTTPHAHVERWLSTLAELREHPAQTLVPGHGAIGPPATPIAQTADYLQWLRGYLRDAASLGGTAAEAVQQALPPRFADLAVMPQEYQRSVHHLFPALEQSTFYAPRRLERN